MFNIAPSSHYELKQSQLIDFIKYWSLAMVYKVVYLASNDAVFTPRVYAQVGLSNQFCPSVVVVVVVSHKNIFITANLEVKTISKQGG